MSEVEKKAGGAVWVVAFDGSETSSLAVEQCLHLIKPERDHLEIVHLYKKGHEEDKVSGEKLLDQAQGKNYSKSRLPMDSSVAPVQPLTLGFVVWGKKKELAQAAGVKSTRHNIAAGDMKHDLCKTATDLEADFLVLGYKGTKRGSCTPLVIALCTLIRLT